MYRAVSYLPRHKHGPVPYFYDSLLVSNKHLVDPYRLDFLSGHLPQVDPQDSLLLVELVDRLLDTETEVGLVGLTCSKRRDVISYIS